eukprot:1192208-Prorocentrum_minimum.AAC.6
MGTHLRLSTCSPPRGTSSPPRPRRSTRLRWRRAPRPWVTTSACRATTPCFSSCTACAPIRARCRARTYTLTFFGLDPRGVPIERSRVQ